MQGKGTQQAYLTPGVGYGDLTAISTNGPRRSQDRVLGLAEAFISTVSNVIVRRAVLCLSIPNSSHFPLFVLLVAQCIVMHMLECNSHSNVALVGIDLKVVQKYYTVQTTGQIRAKKIITS